MMFREKSISKLYAYALAAVFALTLAGCGGGGGGAAAPDPDPTPMPDTRLTDARAAAAMAAAAANEALNAAKAAVTGVADIRNYDSLHYELAGGALDDARRAKMAADDAKAAADGTDDIDIAQKAAADAAMAQTDAEDALVLVNMFVGAIRQAKTDKEAEVADMKLTADLATAVKDAMDAKDATVAAAGEAATKLQELVDSTVGTNAEVHQATLDKAEADKAVVAAKAALSDALDAQTARNLPAAQAAVEAAETARDEAIAKRDAIGAVKMGYDNEAQRMSDVAAARTTAMGSVTAANDDAGKAETAAADVELLAAGTPAATNASAAATAAREAATAAQAAHDAITDDMSKEDADGHADEAARQAGIANGKYMTARSIKDTTESTLGVTTEQLRIRDVAAATTAANDAATDAKKASDAADAAADAAESARNAAHDAYMKARAARTDSTEAKKQYEAAKTAATEARTAANAAMQAYMDAKTAADGIDALGSTDAAKLAQMTAENERDKAVGSKGTAEMKQGDAETAEMAADTAAGTHVIGLFEMANAYHIDTAADPDANTDETEAELIAKNKADHVANVHTAITAAAPVIQRQMQISDLTAPLQGGGSATAAWPYGVDGDGALTGDGRLSISVTTAAGGDPIEFDDVDTEEPGEGVEQVDERNAFKLSRGLGVFSSGYQISGANTEAVVFTDKKQETVTTTEVIRSANNLEVEEANIAQISEPGPLQTGANLHDFTGSFDDDSDAATEPLVGTFNCVDPTMCSQTRSGETVTAIDGYTFSGSATTTTVTPDGENANYLAFGFWLTETEVDEVDNTTNTYVFGAFASGGTPTIADTMEGVTGTATYSGDATGVYSADGSVDYLEGAITLNADFDDLVIKGSIHDIVAGGAPMSDDILLFVEDDDTEGNTGANITDAGAFNGRARMGAGTIDDDGENNYPFNGTWSGQFFNPEDDGADTPANIAPGAAGGTFGLRNSDGTASIVGAYGAHKQ